MKIAIGGISIECCTFSPLLTRLEDFEILRGDRLGDEFPFLNEYTGQSFVPLIWAGAVPGGAVVHSAYDQIKNEFLQGVRQGLPWDGVYLHMHGAMYVEGMEDAEADWVTAIRQVVGPDCLIAASYDLHGNLSSGVMKELNLVSAYRTAPHEDAEETRHRTIDLLVHCLKEDRRPYRAFQEVPLLLPGEKAMTTTEPGGSLYGMIPGLVRKYGLLDASSLVGFAWADEPRSRVSVAAFGYDETSTGQAVKELARAWWERRQEFRFGMPIASVDECIQQALQDPRQAIFISDAGDNITGGAVGDVPYVLERLLQFRVQDAVFAEIPDSSAVATCFQAGPGVELELNLGGKLDPIHGSPLALRGKVIRLNTTPSGNRQVVLQVGGVQVILLERRDAFTTLRQFEELGIQPALHKLVVVKLGYLFPELARIASRSLWAFSPGALNPLVESLPFKRLGRPIYPLDLEMSWSP